MNRTLIGVSIILLLVVITPLTALAYQTQTTQPMVRSPAKKTFIIGLVTKPKLTITGQSLHFRAVYLKYMVFGEKRVVNIHGLQKLSVPNDFTGIVGNHFICAVFDGIPR